MMLKFLSIMLNHLKINHVILPHSRQQFITLCSDSFNHKQSKIVKYWSLKEAVISAETKESVLSINW
ncbi:hypothetical protein D3C71_1667550 [compost metagenome]